VRRAQSILFDAREFIFVFLVTALQLFASKALGRCIAPLQSNAEGKRRKI
jgi:hypothetical protein